MANDADYLLKSNYDVQSVSTISSKKLNTTKYGISGICKSVIVDSCGYSPKATVDEINTYISQSSKLDRILYSEISSFIISLDEGKRGTFSTNVENLLMYVLDDANNVPEDSRKICIKIYDHFQLNLTQIESASSIAERQLAETIDKEKTILHNEIKEVEKEYITILGIFASVVLAFTAGIAFSTSVLENIDSVSAYRIIIVALIIGLVLINIIFALFYYIGLLVDKTKEEKSLRPLWISNGVILIVLLFALIAWYNGSIEDRNTRIESRQHEIITEPFSSY